ncbi:hypothetical protein [Ramlibacter sp. 2FC]|uniref:hypothetical protein n=1 Tax=Ramlibacter sp. 2FC TaxID=2502188 RepID=UPI0010F9A4DB|nr:hypothetical protein [Ramlibacter sp. 2FC]
MGPLDLLNHLLNFAAPALFVALIVTLAAPWVVGRAALAWRVQFAVQAGVGLAVLLGGLVLTGRDGRMGSYAVLVLAALACQWLMSLRR